VLLDAELTALYGVATRRRNEQVRRNTLRASRDCAAVAVTDRWTLPTPRSLLRALKPKSIPKLRRCGKMAHH
jgi:hypothetical protein